MAKGDTKTNQYLDIAANGTRADLPTDTCCETRSQTLIREVAERIITEEETRYREDQILQSEIDEIKNNPDVFDIVPTYAALQAYDTSQLTDKDIIRVLVDETHDGASTYYRWSTSSQTFTYVGETGDYYTKNQVNDLLDNKQDLLTAGDGITIEEESGALVISSTGGGGGTGIIELTSADYNYPTDNPTQIAAWLLPDGIYHSASTAIQWSAYGDSAPSGTFIKTTNSSNIAFVFFYRDNGLNEVILSQPIGAAHYTNLSTSAVKQTTGTSTTDVMSQKAVTSMVFADPDTKYKVQIGGTTAGLRSVAIGLSSQTATSNSYDAVAIGRSACSSHGGSVALGAYSNTSAVGEVNIGTSSTSYGYTGNSNYRLLSGVYDGQSAHDAATVGQITPTTDSSAPTTAAVGRLGQIFIDTATATAYMCVEADDVTPSYTWKQITA